MKTFPFYNALVAITLEGERVLRGCIFLSHSSLLSDILVMVTKATAALKGKVCIRCLQHGKKNPHRLVTFRECENLVHFSDCILLNSFYILLENFYKLPKAICYYCIEKKTFFFYLLHLDGYKLLL